jgi:hypothetical protein
MDSNLYIITDLDAYARELRHTVAENIAQNNEENLDNYISIGQITNLVKDNCLGFDDLNRPILDVDANEQIFQQTLTWFYNITLSRLASLGLVDCAWDEDKEEMIFWISNKASTYDGTNIPSK